MRASTRKASIDGKSRPSPLLAQRASEDLLQLDEAFNTVRTVIPGIQKGLDASLIYMQLIEKRGEQMTHTSIQGIRSQEFSHAKNVYTHFQTVLSALEHTIQIMDSLNDHKLKLPAFRTPVAFDSVTFAKATRSASVSNPSTSLLDGQLPKRPFIPTSQSHISQHAATISPKAVHTTTLTTSTPTPPKMHPHPSTRTQRMFPWMSSRRSSSPMPSTSHTHPQTTL